MAAPEGDYATKAVEVRAERNAMARLEDYDAYEAIAPIVAGPDPAWGPLATDTYVGYLNDPLGKHFTQADWSMVRIMCAAIDAAANSGTWRGSTLEVIMRTMSQLGAGPVERKKAKIAIVEAQAEDDQDLDDGFDVDAFRREMRGES